MFSKKPTKLKDAVGEIPWDEIGRQKTYLGYNGLNPLEHYMPLQDKEVIEKYAFSVKANLQPYGQVMTIGGDVDWIFDNKIIGTNKIRENIRKTIERCGSGSLKVLTNSSVEKRALSYRNAKELQKLGVEVRIRNKDENVRAIIAEQKNENNEIIFKSACIWKRYAKDENYPRVEGRGQKKGEMYTNGYIIKWEDKGEKDPINQIKKNVLLTFNEYSSELWKDSVKTVDDIIAENHLLQEVDRIEEIKMREQMSF